MCKKETVGKFYWRYALRRCLALSKTASMAVTTQSLWVLGNYGAKFKARDYLRKDIVLTILNTCGKHYFGYDCGNSCVVMDRWWIYKAKWFHSGYIWYHIYIQLTIIFILHPPEYIWNFEVTLKMLLWRITISWNGVTFGKKVAHYKYMLIHTLYRGFLNPLLQLSKSSNCQSVDCKFCWKSGDDIVTHNCMSKVV